jgi:hypothetical protein
MLLPLAIAARKHSCGVRIFKSPGEEATLERGRWQVTFGKGLDFEIKILPWAAREIYHDW